MIRNVDVSEISDGRLYRLSDMVKVGCGDCEGCSSCCREVGDTIILDPLDVTRLCEACGKDFEGLLGERVELGFVDGAILPHLYLAEGEGCTFLNGEGRCQIHPYRPGFCRIFPLARYYHDGTFSYILQTGECKKESTVKVKVEKWVDTPRVKTYDRFVADWHFFIQAVGRTMQEVSEEVRGQLASYILRLFYQKPYEGDFYEAFYGRLKEAREVLDDVRGEG